MHYVRELTCGPRGGDSRLAPGSRWKFWVGVGVFFAGLVLLSAAVGVYFYLDARLHSEIEDYVIVDSTNSYGYDDWVFNNSPDSPPLYSTYWMWNLTNPQEILTGSTTIPAYEAIGPFNYRKFSKKIAVEFLSGGEKVSFSEWIYYVFDPKDSFGNPDEILVTNLNQAYLSVMRQTGGEQGLVASMLGPTLGQITGLFTTVFVDIIARQAAASTVLPQLQQAVLQAIQTQLNVSRDEAMAVFLSDWANSTSPNQNLWGQLGTLCGGSGCAPSNIPVATATSLWTVDATIPNFVNADPSIIFLWFSAASNPAGAQAQQLQARFSLSQSQLTLIFNWLSALNVRVVLPQLVVKFQQADPGVAAPQDIGLLQWGTGQVTNFVSVKNLVASNPFNLPGIPEIALWSNRTISFNVSQTKQLVTGPLSLTQVNNVILFFRLLQAGNLQAIKTNWGLDLPQAMKVKEYFDFLGTTFVRQALLGAFNTGNATSPFLGSGGLVTTRTVTQWLWGVQDPLLKLLGQNVTMVSLQSNVTSEEAAYQQANNSLYWTGKGDVDRAFQYIDWQGLTVLPKGNPWAADVPVMGDYGTQFRPFLAEGDTVIVWITEMLRSLRLKFVDDVTKFGINLYRFKIDPIAFDPNPTFYQDRNITGFANMSSSQPLDVYISKPRMLDCAAEWRQKLSGINPSFEDDTFLDIEPYTGYVMDVAKQLQINFLINNATGLNTFNTNIPRNVIYPIFWANLNSEITKTLADDFKNKVYVVVQARMITFYVGLSVGLFLIVASVLVFLLVAYLNWRFQRVEYLSIPSGGM